MFSKNLKAKCHAASALKTVKSTCDSSNYLKVKKKKKVKIWMKVIANSYRTVVCDYWPAAQQEGNQSLWLYGDRRSKLRLLLFGDLEENTR